MTVNMAELFARDPHDHTDEDIKLIIEKLREARKKFVANPEQKGRTPKPLSKEQKAIASLDLDIKL